MNNKITLLVDSGMDLPPQILAKSGTYVIPLNIIYKDQTYIDKQTITAEEIYKRLPVEVPSTSLPNGESIEKILDEISHAGYEKLIIATISSGLSGTNNILRLMTENYPQLDTFVLDTKSVGIGGGLQGVYAQQLIESGLSFEEIKTKLSENVANSRVFFSIPTLEYLKKGGRIGLVSSILGTALNLNPVISCNKEGIYHTVGKTRGRKKSLEKMLSLVEQFIGEHTAYDIGIAYGNCLEDAKAVAEEVKARFNHYVHFYIDEASPALGVHTGPDVIGIGILLRND